MSLQISPAQLDRLNSMAEAARIEKQLAALRVGVLDKADQAAYGSDISVIAGALLEVIRFVRWPAKTRTSTRPQVLMTVDDISGTAEIVHREYVDRPPRQPRWNRDRVMLEASACQLVIWADRTQTALHGGAIMNHDSITDMVGMLRDTAAALRMLRDRLAGKDVPGVSSAYDTIITRSYSLPNGA